MRVREYTEEQSKNRRKRAIILMAVLALAIVILGFIILLTRCENTPAVTDTLTAASDKLESNTLEESQTDVHLWDITAEFGKDTPLYVGDKLTINDVYLTLLYSDGSTRVVNSGFSLEPDILGNAGEMNITVHYGEKSTSFSVMVQEVVPVSIEVCSLPIRTSYLQYDKIDTEGLSLTVTNNNGSNRIIYSGFSISPDTLSHAGTQPITVDYHGMTSTFELYVENVSKGLKYADNNDGTCKVIGIGTCKDKDIVIPHLLPSGHIVTYIDEFAFDSCEFIETVSMPDSIEGIGNFAFGACHALKEINISKNTVSFGQWIFWGCDNLNSILINPENPQYYSKNNCIIKTNGHYLIECWSEAIPYGVVSIGVYSMRSSNELKSISIPASVIEICRRAFADCSELSFVSVPRSITKIEWAAFENCDKLSSLEYAGTKEQWENIDKQDDWYLRSGISVIHCTDGDINIFS